MKMNPASFNKAQRLCLTGRRCLAFPRQWVWGGGGGLGWEGGGWTSHLRHPAGTRTLDKHPRDAQQFDLENAVVYFESAFSSLNNERRTSEGLTGVHKGTLEGARVGRAELQAHQS
jgi:hypothetical protein